MHCNWELGPPHTPVPTRARAPPRAARARVYPRYVRACGVPVRRPRLWGLGRYEVLASGAAGGRGLDAKGGAYSGERFQC